MMYEKGFFTYSFSPIDGVLDNHIIDIENPGDEEEKSGKMVSP